MDKPILYLQDYLPKQIELEEQYYEKLNTILLILVSIVCQFLKGTLSLNYYLL